MFSFYEQNLAMVYASYEVAKKLRSIASLHPEFKEVVDYAEVGPRVLMLHFSGVPDNDVYRDCLPSTYIQIERLFFTSQMDDYGNLCWADEYAYHWDGYYPYLVPDYGAKGLEEGDPYPYVLHVPACH